METWIGWSARHTGEVRDRSRWGHGYALASSMVALAISLAACSSSNALAAHHRSQHASSGSSGSSSQPGPTTTSAVVPGGGATTTLGSGQPTATTTSTPPQVPVTSPSATTTATTTTAPAKCNYGRYQNLPILPDLTCTPGALNPAVTQATLSTTICSSGFYAANQPSQAFSSAGKAAAMVLYASPGPASNYVYNPSISIELGGSNSATTNFWPMPTAYGVVGDKKVLSSTLHGLVCAGTLPLATAQSAMATNWVAAYVKYVGPLP